MSLVWTKTKKEMADNGIGKFPDRQALVQIRQFEYVNDKNVMCIRPRFFENQFVRHFTLPT